MAFLLLRHQLLFLPYTPALVDFTFTYILAYNKAVLPAQYVVLSFRVMELVLWWAFPMNVAGYEIWLKIEFSVFYPNFLLFPYSLSCQKKWKSCSTLCDPMDCGLPGTSLRGILQARILEWITIPSSRGSSQPRDPTQVSRIAGRFFTIWATREAKVLPKGAINYSVLTLENDSAKQCVVARYLRRKLTRNL